MNHTPLTSGNSVLTSSSTLLDRARGCLLGGALGDALGNPVEFLSAAAISQRHGCAPPAGLDYAGGPIGLITDDTQMTLFTAEGLLRAASADRADAPGAVIEEMRRAYLRWFITQGHNVALDLGDRGGLLGEPRLHARRAPGNTCLSALDNLATNPGAKHTADLPANNSKGCGAVMRVAPVGLAAKSTAAAFELALDAGALTHGHPSGYLSGAYFAALIWELARGAKLATAMDRADELLRTRCGADEMIAILKKVRVLGGVGDKDAPRPAPPTIETIEALGGGWVGEEALAIALVCVLTREGDDPSSIQRALWRAVHHGGDSDSTGAIAGNLLGAMLGTACLPDAWLATLELRERIEELATALGEQA